MTSDCVVGQWTFVSRLPIMKKINYLGESTLVPLELKSTINLPNTGFPMKANLPQNEPKIMARWEQMRIYERIREVRKGAPVYVLHDGPPYANGPIHLGTAMNKCLKDFIVKSKSMSGFDSPYVPGWDCHGLPIEIKVDQQLGGKKLQMRPVDVRAECRKYAEKYLDLQRQQFKRIGVFGRWDEPYSTMTPQYESAVVAELYAFLEKESVYKGLRSVYWCIHDETALAEAEVEYENHTSPTVWVKYQLRDDPAKLDPVLKGKKVFTVIWTTTPWTLPASMAVAFHPDEKYVALESESEGEVYIVAEKLAAEFSNKAGLAATHKLAHFPGKKLEYLNFAHPFLDRAILGVVADYVTMDTGTGVVHTAPSHGAEDFATGVKYKLDLTGNVDEIKKVKWDPAWGEERISNMIATRPDWCISRQRVWGVPIAVFLCEGCGKPLNDPALNRKVINFFGRFGADAWYTPEADALAASAKCDKCGSTKFSKETDIVDVWFESGSSHVAVLGHEPNLPWPADIYLEGADQYRGWFHSSLLCAIGAQGRPPYRMVATHGWTLDEHGSAMSKSRGNDVDPVDVADRLGGEIVRLWAASVDFREDVVGSEKVT